MKLNPSLSGEQNILNLINLNSRITLQLAEIALGAPVADAPPQGKTSNTKMAVAVTSDSFATALDVHYRRANLNALYPSETFTPVEITNTSTYAQNKTAIALKYHLATTDFEYTGSLPTEQQTSNITITAVAGSILYMGSRVIAVKNTSADTRIFALDVASLAHGVTAIPNVVTGVNGTITAPAMVSDVEKRNGRNTISFLSTGRIDFPATQFVPSIKTGDFTIEFWLKTSTAASNCIFTGQLSTTSYLWHMQFYLGNFVFYFGAVNIFSVADDYNATVWKHYAVSRSGNTWRLFINGVLKGTVTNAGAAGAGMTGTGFALGTTGAAGKWAGWIDNFNIHPSAKYAADFTPT